METIRIVLDSQDKLSGTNTNANYLLKKNYFKTNQLYKLSIMCHTEFANLQNADNQLCYVYIDNLTNETSDGYNLIGILRPVYALVTGTHERTSYEFNNEIHSYGLLNEFINVRIVNRTNSTPYLATNPNYVLILQFTPIK